MNKSTRIKTRVAIGGGLLMAGVSALTGCSDPNYDGIGNDFKVAGIIQSIEEDGTINIEQKDLRIISAIGKAATWFPSGSGQHTFTDIFYFEPSYNKPEPGFFGKCETEINIGRVFNVEGTEITTEQLKAGQTVIIDGDIRDSSFINEDYCQWDDRPVYETARITYKNLADIK